MRQEGEARYVLHLLYATPVLRGASEGEMARSIEVIEDLVPLRDVECTVRVPQEIKWVLLVPSGEDLKWSQQDGRARFVVPEVLCHQMVELSF